MIPGLDCYVHDDRRIRRVTLVFPMDQRESVCAELDEGGWRTIQSGPYTDATMWPSVDVSRGKVVVEREE